MNREIKFRALIEYTDTGERYWEYYGTLCEPCWYDPTLNDRKIIVKDLQFTGCLDKNGKKIYEGDIYSWYDGIYGGTRYGVIVYSPNKLSYRTRYKDHEGKTRFTDVRVYALNGDVDIEIIGNVFDNPELLKKGK